MEKLDEELNRLIEDLEDSNALRTRLRTLTSVYPFNKVEFIISNLLASNKLSLEEYNNIRQNFINRNKYLHVFEYSNTRFGIDWANGELKKLVPNLEKPSIILDKNFSGQYDFILLPNIKIEVKASRAVEKKSKLPLPAKSLLITSDKPFEMNFQQSKPEFCDVFIWLAVWRDEMKCWVLSSFEVENNSLYSDKQHRKNVGEGQLHITNKNIGKFDKYLSPLDKIEENIRKAFEREKKLRKIT